MTQLSSSAQSLDNSHYLFRCLITNDLLATVAGFSLPKNMATRPPVLCFFTLPCPSEKNACLVVAQELMLGYVVHAFREEVLLVGPEK